jgi:carbapenem resistance CarG-like protein
MSVSIAGFKRKVMLAAGTLILGACMAIAAGAGKTTAIHVPYGITNLPLTGDGVEAMLVRARRESFNAHDFDVLSIYARVKTAPESDISLLLVPVWQGKNEAHELSTSEGADCKLKMFRVVAEPDHDLQLVVARRAFGNSYADEGEVTFTWFALKRNQESLPGRPRYYFESTRTEKAKKPYCDVDEAFDKELGLGPL